MLVRFAPRTQALLLHLLLCAACTRSRGTSSADPPHAVPSETSTKDACDPAALGLGTAKPLTSWKVPQGCTPRDLAQGPEPTHIRSVADFQAHFTCTGDAQEAARSAVDFTQYELAIAQRMLPPAGMGYVAVDDGVKVTNISRQRPPCPNDPHPMPMQIVQAYLLPSHATRVYAETACTIPAKGCP